MSLDFFGHIELRNGSQGTLRRKSENGARIGASQSPNALQLEVRSLDSSLDGCCSHLQPLLPPHPTVFRQCLNLDTNELQQ